MSLVNHLLDQLHPQPSPDWLAELRHTLSDRLRDTKLPGRQVEDWRYTPLTALDQLPKQIELRSRSAVSTEDLQALIVPEWPCHRVVFVNGHFAPQLSYLDELPADVRLTSLASADVDLMDGLRPMLERALGEGPAHVLATLNTAALSDGLVVEVATGSQVRQPLHCVFLTVPSEQSLACNVRNIVRLGEGADLRLLEHHIGLGESDHLSNVFNQFDLAAGSTLNQVRLQQQSEGAHLITRQDVLQQSDSRFVYTGLDLGHGLARHDLNADLRGERAAADLSGAWCLTGRAHVDNHCRVDHRVPNTQSDEFFKGVLDQRSRAVFNGKVVVHPGADGTDARQTNNNLLLSKMAEIDTKPELEIYADDVKCAHGATVGELDPQQLFYLQSRGISREQAKQILTQAFCAEILTDLDDSRLRDYLSELIQQTLAKEANP